MTSSSNDPFVPLSFAPATKKSRGDFRILMAERPETARPLRELNHPAPASSSSQTQRSTCEPRVTLQKQADRITGIHIECSCGQVIDLKCAYQE